jgi:hypothetical protein
VPVSADAGDETAFFSHRSWARHASCINPPVSAILCAKLLASLLAVAGLAVFDEHQYHVEKGARKVRSN